MSSELLISEASDLLGLTPKALRHYEKIGLIEPGRSENGYRVYTADHVLRLLRIRRLQSLGLSLMQIKTLLNDQADRSWTAILTTLLEEVEAQIETLEQRRAELEDLLADENADLEAVTEVVPVDLQPAQEYLDQYLTGPQASLWAEEKHFDALLASSAFSSYLDVLRHWLGHAAANGIGQVGPVQAGIITPGNFVFMGQAGLTQEDQA